METCDLSKGLFVSESTLDDLEASSFASNVLTSCSDTSNFQSSSFRTEESGMGHKLGSQLDPDGQCETKHPPKELLSLDEQLQQQLSHDRLRLKLVQAYNICATHIRDPGTMNSSTPIKDPTFELVDNFWQGTNPTHVMQQIQQRIAALSSSKHMTPRSMHQPCIYDLEHLNSSSCTAEWKWTISTPRGVSSTPSNCVQVQHIQEPILEHNYESLIMIPVCSELDEEIDSTFPSIPFLDQLQMLPVTTRSSSDKMKIIPRVIDPMKCWRPKLESCDSSSQLRNDFDNHGQPRLGKPASMYDAEQAPGIEIEVLSSNSTRLCVNAGSKLGQLRTQYSSLGTCNDANPKNLKQQQGEAIEMSLVSGNTMKTEKGAREGKQTIHMEVVDTAMLNHRAKKKPRTSTATSFSNVWVNGLQNLAEDKGDTKSVMLEDFIAPQHDIRIKRNTNATTPIMSNSILQQPSAFDNVKGCEPCTAAATTDNASMPIEIEQLLIPETELSIDDMPLFKLEDVGFDTTGVLLSKPVMDDVPMIEVRMMENKQVMVQLRAKDRPGLFTDLMLVLCQLKLEVQHANIRTCSGNRYDVFAAKIDISLEEKQTTQDIAAALSHVIDSDHHLVNN